MKRRTTYNPKRKILDLVDPQHAEWLIAHVSYGGNPEHKRNPGDFDLTPSVIPRPDKTLCDAVGTFSHRIALRYLREGIRKGLVSVQTRGDFPQNIWAVTDSGEPLEAQLENPTRGVYHGYPMPETDPLREKVLIQWQLTQ
jgi:hypothetical protein